MYFFSFLVLQVPPETKKIKPHKWDFDLLSVLAYHSLKCKFLMWKTHFFDFLKMWKTFCFASPNTKMLQNRRVQSLLYMIWVGTDPNPMFLKII